MALSGTNFKASGLFIFVFLNIFLFFFCQFFKGSLRYLIGCQTPLESPLLNFSSVDTSNPSSLYLGLEWPGLIPPIAFAGSNSTDMGCVDPQQLIDSHGNMGSVFSVINKRLIILVLIFLAITRHVTLTCLSPIEYPLPFNPALWKLP